MTTETARALLHRHGLPEDIIDGALCLHAQELAVLQRLRMDELDLTGQTARVVGRIVDLIDPTKAPAVSSAVVAPPADQTALRDRIAEALLDHLSRTADIRTSSSGGELAFMPEVTDAERMRMADAVLAVLPAPADRAAVLREAADRVDNEELPHDYVDMFDNGARWAARLLRRMADETATEPPQPSLRERHRAAWHALTPDQQTARLAELDEPAAGARQDGAPDDVVTELTEAEFHDAAGKALARLGLTYAELEDQARRRDFSSAQARSLWVTIGGAAPAGARQDGEAQ